MVSAMAVRYSSFMALTGPVMSMVTVTMPSASFSYLNTLMSIKTPDVFGAPP